MSRRLLAAVAVLLALSLGVAGAAQAGAPSGFGTNPPPTHSADPPTTSSGGSSGGEAHKTVKTCSLYANDSRFGLSCVTPGGGDNAPTIREILGAKESLPTCFDEPISASVLASEYPSYAPNPLAPYYLHTCITGLDENRSPADQPHEQISPVVINIVVGAPRCFNYDEATNKPTPFTASQLTNCVMTLTGKQHQVVTGITSNDAQIPGITIAPQPSTRVRTNEDVAYVDTATTQGSNPRRTPDLTIGGVTLWATMDSYKIYPDGPGGISKTCDGTQPVTATDTRASKPDACWWKYDKSSADQPDMTYPFRAEADWTVHYSTGPGDDQVLDAFRKYTDLTLPVYDIQTIVVR